MRSIQAFHSNPFRRYDDSLPILFVFLFIVGLFTSAWSLEVKAQSESIPEHPAIKCDWLIGRWQCLEKSTNVQRSLIVESFVQGEWRIALFDEDIPDENSDEWTLHKSGDDLLIGNSMKESTECNSDGHLQVTRGFYLNIRGKNPYATVMTRFTPRNDGRLSNRGMSFSIFNWQGTSKGFTESYSCQAVTSN